MKMIVCFFFAMASIRCNELFSDDLQNRKIVSNYLGINLDSASQINIFEYNIMDGYDYPKSVYIGFKYSHPDAIIRELKLLPSKPLLKDSTRFADYEYAKLINDFWRMRSTEISSDIFDVENKQLTWWKPDRDTSVSTYAGFYNEFYKRRIVKSKEKWTGRLVLQAKQDTVFIQISLFQGA